MTYGTSVMGLMGVTEDIMWSEKAMFGGAALMKIFEGDYSDEQKQQSVFNYAALLVSASVFATAEHILGEEVMDKLEAEAEELSKLGEDIK